MRFLSCATHIMFYTGRHRKVGGMFDQKLVFPHDSILCGVQKKGRLYFHCVRRKTSLVTFWYYVAILLVVFLYY